MISKEQLKKYILDYLANNRLMTVCTCENNIPWASTVFYAYDNDLNIYFISRPDTRKTRNIETNHNVSVAINHVQPKSQKVRGIQLEGKAEILNKERDKQQLEIFGSRFHWADDYLYDHELYKIKPNKVYYLDDELFGPGGREILEL